jgi:superfamily I DNA/RNA helicase
MKYTESQLEGINHINGNCCVFASAGSGKALKNGTKVMTMDGSINIEDLKIGDYVLDNKGKRCKVTGVFHQGMKEIYEVEFSDGNVIECCKDHLWTYQTAYMRDNGKWATHSLEYIINNNKLKIKSGKYYKTNIYIPMIEPINYPKKELPLHPYLLGVILGDGCLKKTNQTFTNSENDIIDKVNMLLNDIGYELHNNKSKNNEIDYSINIKSAEIFHHKKSYFSQTLYDLGLLEKHSYDKFIPNMYLHTSIEDRVELLNGLIDTDGYNQGAYYEYSSSSERLIKDVKYLCESLGLTAKLSIKESPSYTYKDNKLIGRTSYRLFIKVSRLFIKLHSSKKHELKHKIPQGYARRSITDVRKTNNKEHMTCISVDSEDKLFLIDNFIVTHNTSVLVERIKNLVNNHNIPQDNILALTFSKKATMNMQDRLNQDLSNDYSNINISTFHALGYKMLREQNYFPKWYQPIAEWELKKAIEDIVVNMGLENIKDKDKIDLKNIISYIAKQKSSLIRHTDTQAKTRGMPYDFKSMCNIYREYEKYKTNKSKIDFNDMILHMYYLLRDNQKVREFYQNKYKYILMDECLPASQYVKTNKGIISIRKLYEDYEKGLKLPLALSYNINRDKFEYKPITWANKSENRELYEINLDHILTMRCTGNHKILTNNGYIMIDDLDIHKDRVIIDINNKLSSRLNIVSIIKLHKEDVYDIEVVDNHNFVTTDTMNKYKSGIVVHNCQDTDKAQYEILKLLAETNNNLFVVGDPLQNIYTFRGCDNKYFINFPKQWKDTKVVNLGLNFRSSDNIVKMANKLVEGMLETTHENYIESVAFNPKFKQPEYTVYNSDIGEAQEIAKKIKSMIDDKTNNYKLKDFTVLVRTNYQLQAIENAFFEADLDYCGVGVKSFYDRKEIKSLIYYLRLIDDINNDEAFENICNIPNRYLGKVFLDEVSKYAKSKDISMFNSMIKFPRSEEWRYKKGINEIVSIISKAKNIKADNVDDIISFVRKETDYDTFISRDILEDEENEKLDNVNKFESYCADFKTIRELLDRIDGINAHLENAENNENKVNLMTIHKSKGLEFSVVFIPSVNQDILPHAKSENTDEEKRLFYVAITRAEKEVYISSSRYGNRKVYEPSEFLYKIFDDVDKKFNNDGVDNKLKAI